MRGELGALGLVAARLELGAEIGDLLGQEVERLLHAGHAELLEPLARLHRGDHLDVGAEDLGVGLVPHGVIAVEVAVHHVTDGEVGDLVPDLLDQGLRRRRLRVGVHDQDMIAVDDDRRVAIQHGGRLGDRAVDARRDLLEIEQLGRGGAAGGAWPSSATARTTELHGMPLAAAASPAAFNRPSAWRRVSRGGSSAW